MGVLAPFLTRMGPTEVTIMDCTLNLYKIKKFVVKIIYRSDQGTNKLVLQLIGNWQYCILQLVKIK